MIGKTNSLGRRQFLTGLLGSAVASAASGQNMPDNRLAVPPPAKPPPRPRQLITAANLGAEVDYAVFDRTGSLLEGRGADRPVSPASTLKVLTSLYALDRLGADARFSTDIVHSNNNLFLVGGGDPVLDTDRLAELADKTVAAWSNGSPSHFYVTGASLPYIAEISPEQADYLAYNPSVSGIILNFNRVHLSWKAGGTGMTLQARSSRNRPTAYSIRAAGVGQGLLFSWREEDGHEIWSVNRAGLRRAGSRWLPVRQPELYAADVFQTLCRARGLVLPTPEVVSDLPEGAQPVANISSVRLWDILLDMMKYSTNLTAEVVGLHASQKRDLIASAKDMQAWAEARGITDLDLYDHSGMSPDTRITARAMARIIATLGEKTDLRRLMKHVGLQDSRGYAVDGNLQLRAKTGTLNFVSNLAGYGEIPGHGEVIFAVYIGDQVRRAATEGQELPAGVVTWIHRSKFLQQQLIRSWVLRYGRAVR